MAVTSALPWRMGTGDYKKALSQVTEAPSPGRLTPAPWDPDLAETIAAKGVAVHEERVTDLLIADLSTTW